MKELIIAILGLLALAIVRFIIIYAVTYVMAYILVIGAIYFGGGVIYIELLVLIFIVVMVGGYYASLLWNKLLSLVGVPNEDEQFKKVKESYWTWKG